MPYRKRRADESEEEYSGELREYYRSKTYHYRTKNREKTLEYTRRASTKRRIKILEHYGGIPPKCNCCGETIHQVLELDHINGGGNKHRQEFSKHGGSVYLYLWLIKNNFPEGFQVLCRNCNKAKGILGLCPHQTRESTGPISQGGAESTESIAKPLQWKEAYGDPVELKEQILKSKISNTRMNHYLDIKKEDIEGGPQLHRCESPFNCRSMETILVKGEGYDDEGTLKGFEKWLCDKHAR